MLLIPARSLTVAQASRSKGELHPTRAGEGRDGGSERSAPWALHVHRARPRPAPPASSRRNRAVAPPAAWVERPAAGAPSRPKRVAPLPQPLGGGGYPLLTAMLTRFACSARITTPPSRRFRRQPRIFLSTHARCTPGRCATLWERPAPPRHGLWARGPAHTAPTPDPAPLHSELRYHHHAARTGIGLL